MLKPNNTSRIIIYLPFKGLMLGKRHLTIICVSKYINPILYFSCLPPFKKKYVPHIQLWKSTFCDVTKPLVPIPEDSSHPAHHLFELLPSKTNPYRSIKRRSHRFINSLDHRAMTMLKAVLRLVHLVDSSVEYRGCAINHFKHI